MATTLHAKLSQLEIAASRLGLNRARWANRAGLRPETLSRLFSREDCDLDTLTRLAVAANHSLMLVAQPERRMPEAWNREIERKYLALCASRSTEVSRWLREGPRYFMSGLAMMMASSRSADRDAYLALAVALCPSMQEEAEFRTWLAMTPAKPSRFLPMVRALQSVPV